MFAGQPGPVWSQLPGVNPFVADVSTFPFNVWPILVFPFLRLELIFDRAAGI
jgi:hypothetical protein